MAAKAVVLPCAILGSIVAVGFIFMWWFFPYIWKKGTKHELEELAITMGDASSQSDRAEIAGEHAREYVEAMKARYKARAEGRELDEPPPVYRPFQRAH